MLYISIVKRWHILHKTKSKSKCLKYRGGTSHNTHKRRRRSREEHNIQSSDYVYCVCDKKRKFEKFLDFPKSHTTSLATGYVYILLYVDFLHIKYSMACPYKCFRMNCIPCRIILLSSFPFFWLFNLIKKGIVEKKNFVEIFGECVSWLSWFGLYLGCLW